MNTEQPVQRDCTTPDACRWPRCSCECVKEVNDGGPYNGLVPRLLTDDEVAECDERYFFSSARAIQRKFCEVNGIALADGLPPSQSLKVGQDGTLRIPPDGVTTLPGGQR